MRRFLFFMAAVVTAVSGFAADQVRYWNEGPLSWSDFEGNPPMKTTPTYFCGRLEVRTDVDREEVSRLNTEVLYSTYALAVMDKANSYADSASCSKQMLRYHQLQFDMLEVLRRRLQADLNSGMTGLEADNRVDYYQRIYAEQIADLARMTVNGSNDNRLQEYEYFTRKQLDEYLLPAVPEVKPGKFTYGLFVGTGALIPTGEIADVFNSSWLFDIGLTAGYGRLFVKADIAYGQAKFVDPHQNVFGKDDEWPTNRFANQLSGTVSAGFQVLSAKHFAITPHIGGGWTNYSWQVTDVKMNDEGVYEVVSESRKVTPRDFNFMAGIDFDWHFHTVVSDRPFFLSGKREQYTSSLRLTPYVMRQSYSLFVPERGGWQVGVTLSYVGLARALGFK